MTQLNAVGDGRDLEPHEYATALVNILEDLSYEKERLGYNQAAILNILDDFSTDKRWVESTQAAILNILDDFNADKLRLESAQAAILNILDDFSEEKALLESAQAAILNILEDFDAEKKNVEAINQELRREIIERHKAEEDLKQASERLARSNAELEDFTYVVSHDLKEPLRGVEAFSTFLAEDYGDKLDEQGQRYTHVLRRSAVRMKDLIEDLLELSRIGRVQPQYTTVPLKPLLEDVREDLEFALKEKKVDLRIQPDLPTITCDKVRMKEVFKNLISNAIKFNEKPQPIVEIACREEDGYYTTSVADNGIGIDEKYHEKIFQIFQRLGRREDYAGTGAGLTICKKIVEAHSGKIWLESKVGQGSTFLFAIPKKPAQGVKQGRGKQNGNTTVSD